MFLLTCLLRGMTPGTVHSEYRPPVSTHMPLARHDVLARKVACGALVFLLTCLLRGMTSVESATAGLLLVSTHMPLARHDLFGR